MHGDHHDSRGTCTRIACHTCQGRFCKPCLCKTNEKSFPQPEGAPLVIARRRFSFNIRANVASHRSVLTCLTLVVRSRAVSLAAEAFRTLQHEGNPSGAQIRSSSSTASSLWHAPHPAPLRTLGHSTPATSLHSAPLLTFCRTASSAGPHPSPLFTPRCFLRRSAVAPLCSSLLTPFSTAGPPLLLYFAPGIQISETPSPLHNSTIEPC
jgi:hypothetical protein